MSDTFYAIAGITQDYLKGPKYPIDYSYYNKTYNQKSDEFYINKLFTEEELERLYNTLDKDMLVKWQILSEDFLERHLADLNLLAILRYQVVSEAFMRRHCFNPKFESGYHSLVLQIMLRCQGLSTEFIRSIMDYIEKYSLFHMLCTFQYIEEDLMYDLINNYTDTPFNNVIVRHLLKYQNIPKEIIHNHPYMTVNKVYRDEISKHQYISQELCSDFDLTIDSALLLTPDEWKFEVRNTGKFATFKDYFVGYKIVRADNYSDFNYRFKYDKENTYETFSDYGYNNIGAGFGIFDQESAKITLAKRFRNADKFKIIEVKIYYKDVTFVNMVNGNNVIIRAKEINIL